MSEGKRILVTGSRGMLAYSLVPILKSGGYYVCGIDIQEADITDCKSVSEIANDFRPDLVVHTAAMTAVDACEDMAEEAEKINATGAGNVARAADAVGAAIVFISTDYVFDGSNKEPYLEDDPVCPISSYGRSKAKGEEEVAAAAKKHVIIRTSWLYGSGGRNFVDTMLRLAGDRDELRVVSDQFGGPTYTAHLSQAIKAVADSWFAGNLHGFEGIYHATNAGVCSWYDFAVEIFKQSGITGKTVVPITSAELLATMNFKAPRPAFSVLSNQKLNRVFGFIMSPWQDGLKEYLAEAGRSNV